MGLVGAGSITFLSIELTTKYSSEYFIKTSLVC